MKRNGGMFEAEEEPSSDMANPIQLLRDDHAKLKHLFEEFERTDDSSAKRRIVETALAELSAHAEMEEEVFYPAVRKQMDEEEDLELMDEALEEHHVAKMLIGELESMRPSEKRYEAKFKVLSEAVKHHIQEEESEMLPKVEELGLDLESLGQRMMRRKSELQENASSPRSARRAPAGKSPARATSSGRSSSPSGRRTSSSQAKSRKKAA
ncbi:MAG: hemerythrin domain-containing protein [Nitrospiria bacterium]